jgi:hypothetical protein
MRKLDWRRVGARFRRETSGFLSRALDSGLDPAAELQRLAHDQWSSYEPQSAPPRKSPRSEPWAQRGGEENEESRDAA